MNAQNRKAFLDMIAFSELGKDLLRVSDNGYKVIVGSTAKKPILFYSYADHPRKIVWINSKLSSSAAGRYQIKEDIFDAYKKQLGLKDFGHDAQDAIALQLLKECKALEDIDAGRFSQAVKKCRSRWASLPGAGYGQHENSLDKLKKAYADAGGNFA